MLVQQADVARFADAWADTIAAQGFATGVVVRRATAQHQERAA
jgi:hypothetical protein